MCLMCVRETIVRPFFIVGVTTRETSLRSELPTFPTGVPMNIELDGVILVQNLGKKVLCSKIVIQV